MSKKKFNPKDWATATLPQSLSSLSSINPDKDIEVITKRIEATATDIAPNYTDWRDLGFALADALGESGRSYYHRLSCFYPSYSQSETDRQFDNCLKAHGHGVTIKTLYHLAKSAGIDVSIKTVPTVPKVPQTKNAKSPNTSNEDIEDLEETAEKPLPTIPDTVYKNLLDFNCMLNISIL